MCHLKKDGYALIPISPLLLPIEIYFSLRRLTRSGVGATFKRILRSAGTGRAARVVGARSRNPGLRLSMERFGKSHRLHIRPSQGAASLLIWWSKTPRPRRLNAFGRGKRAERHGIKRKANNICECRAPPCLSDILLITYLAGPMTMRTRERLSVKASSLAN